LRGHIGDFGEQFRYGAEVLAVTECTVFRHALTGNQLSQKTPQDRHPTRIISLEEFTPHYNAHQHDIQSDSTNPIHSHGLDVADMDQEPTYYTHPCRCSAQIVITTTQLEEGVDVVGCDGCGEWIGVGYEVVEDEEGPSDG
jgi:diphthamide biosynthesis protein 4